MNDEINEKLAKVEPHIPKKKVSPTAFAGHVYRNFKEYMTYQDSMEENCAFGEYIFGLHMGDARDFYFEFVQKLYNALMQSGTPYKGKKKCLSFGDADDYVTLLMDTPKKKVFHWRNVCSCADITQWIFVWDIDDFKSEIHVREINDRSDYPKKPYPQKLGLRFYRDREFIINYIQKYHMTPLGGVYGDIRDSGYVISYERYELKNPLNPDAEINKAVANLNGHVKDVFHLFYYYGVWKNFTFLMRYVNDEIQEKKLDKKQKGE